MCCKVKAKYNSNKGILFCLKLDIDFYDNSVSDTNNEIESKE